MTSINNVTTVNKMGLPGMAKKDSQDLGMQDFLMLMVAQMQNQDVMNPMDNTQFVAQLAEFSTLQAMTDTLAISKQNQALSLVGQNVVVTDSITQANIEGVVESISFKNGDPLVFINGLGYGLDEINTVTMTDDNTQEILGQILESVETITEQLLIQEQPPIEDQPIEDHQEEDDSQIILEQ